MEVLNLIKGNFFKSAIKTVTKKESGITDVSIIAPVKCQPLWRFPGLKVLEPHSTKPLNKIIKKRIELIAPAQEEVNGRLSQIFLLYPAINKEITINKAPKTMPPSIGFLTNIPTRTNIHANVINKFLRCFLIKSFNLFPLNSSRWFAGNIVSDSSHFWNFINYSSRNFF